MAFSTVAGDLRGVGDDLAFGLDLELVGAAGFGLGRGVGDGVGFLTGWICSRASIKRRLFSTSLTCPRVTPAVSMKHSTQMMMAIRFRFRTPQGIKRSGNFKLLNKERVGGKVRLPVRSD